MGISIEMKEGKEIQPEVTQKPQETVVQTKPSEEVKYVRLEDLEKVNQAIQNTREYNNRQLAEIKAALEELKPKPVEAAPDDLDNLVQKDWKLGVEKVAEKVIERKLTAKQEQETALTQQQLAAKLLNESKEKVMARHPELEDPNHPKTKEFLKVLEENPDFKSNPRGPMLAAFEMENRLKTHDTIESRETKVERPVRAKATSVPAGSPATNRPGVTLSKNDLDFCRLNGINPENYKRYKGQTEARA